MITIVNGVVVVKVISGQRGMSAFEVAVEEGFLGTKPEWLESLKPGGTRFTNTYAEAEALTLTAGQRVRVAVDEKEGGVKTMYLVLEDLTLELQYYIQ